MSEGSAEGAGGMPAGLVAGSRVGGYRLEEQVGAGGMAVVFRAVDERLGRQVALKVLAPAFAADAEFRQRFLRESRAAATVDDPHIIPVHEAGEADGVLFIAMRFVPGGDVRSLLAQAGALPPARVAAIISPVASALDAAHAAGLVHRDVKPANMLVDVRPDRPDHVYLSDFGLSKGMLSAGLTETGQFLGTPDYTAPEQIEGRAVDGRTDQYALACSAFELLCGEPPFRRDKGLAVLFAHLQQSPPSLASRRPGVPGAADAVFARALAKAPQDRYPTCGQFAGALREALGVAAYHSGPGAVLASGQSAEHPATEIAGPAGLGNGEAAVPAGAATISAMRPAPTRPDTSRRPATRLRRISARAWIFGGASAGIALIAALVIVLANSPKTSRPPAGANNPASSPGSPTSSPASAGSSPALPFRDDLSSAANGWTVSGNGASARYANGGYEIDLAATRGSSGAAAPTRNFPDPAPPDITVQVSARLIVGNALTVYGIECRAAADNSNAYYFAVSDGHFEIFKDSDGSLTTLVSRNTTAVSPNGTNQLQAACTSTGTQNAVQLEFWVNGQKLGDVTDPTNPLPIGKVRLFVTRMGLESTAIEVEFDNFAVT